MSGGRVGTHYLRAMDSLPTHVIKQGTSSWRFASPDVILEKKMLYDKINRSYLCVHSVHRGLDGLNLTSFNVNNDKRME